MAWEAREAVEAKAMAGVAAAVVVGASGEAVAMVAV